VSGISPITARVKRDKRLGVAGVDGQQTVRVLEHGLEEGLVMNVEGGYHLQVWPWPKAQHPRRAGARRGLAFTLTDQGKDKGHVKRTTILRDD
jgi:hypothetical protein